MINTAQYTVQHNHAIHQPLVVLVHAVNFVCGVLGSGLDCEGMTSSLDSLLLVLKSHASQ